MGHYRKKPIVIEAIQFVGVMAGGSDRGFVVTSDVMPHWLAEGFDKPGEDEGSVRVRSGSLIIQTLEGFHEAKPKDWIIKGVQGELYPCKPDIFAATYEAAEM